ncbi:zinc finger, C2H2 type [Trichinella nativa]|uniref:non-specific serine/threonine protein kinase n=1 Tax=Trichinella nativa TaxID=6335 RepID=A0A1Y3EK93_9BILA|nr:zinc finger, C2H2 type [Trichinella nativa]
MNFENTFHNRFKLNYMMGKGTFGVVYVGMDKVTNEEVAIKIEKRMEKPSMLCFEKKVYKFLSGSSFVPAIKHFGTDNFNFYLSMELLGPNMEDVLEARKRELLLTDVCSYAVQIIKAIQFIHERGFIHRDLKPENILLRQRDLSTHEVACFSVRYMSISAHLGIQQSRRDDMQTIGYILTYLAKGKLPWQDMQGLPSAFSKYMKYCRSLDFASEPDYKYLYRLFEKTEKYENTTTLRNGCGILSNASVLTLTELVTMERKSYCCNTCHKPLKCYSSLRTHQKLHNKYGEFVCHICGADFIWKGSFISHASFHVRAGDALNTEVCNFISNEFLLMILLVHKE